MLQQSLGRFGREDSLQIMLVRNLVVELSRGDFCRSFQLLSSFKFIEVTGSRTRQRDDGIIRKFESMMVATWQ